MPRIEDYALIGDCETAALVSREGSIDWLCWPRFDSAACFAALLGTPEHGRWLLAPRDPRATIERRYRDGTLVIDTDYVTADGAVTVTDFMPIRGAASDLIRIVTGRRGRVEMAMELVLRFDYGVAVPWVTRIDERRMRAVSGPDKVVLTTDAQLHGEGMKTVARFSVGAGESATFVLAYAPSHLADPPSVDAHAALADTEAYWREWNGHCTYRGPAAEAVTRSLVTLKALTYAPTGGLVAAPTTSLPEHIGGTRNWDYRYCWLRDATLTLLALMDAGYHEEATAWRDWLLRTVAGSPAQIRIMYGLAGERRLPEMELSWLPGYESSTPVRIGNAASGQLQLDVFGEVLDAMYQARRAGLAANEAGWALQRALVEHLETVWQEPDEGLWEVRGGRRHFTHSKVMSWVALDRTVRSAEDHGLAGPIDAWRALRQRIHDDVCSRGFDTSRGTFVQSYGAQELDAALLLIPLVGFLPADDPRVRGTVTAIENDLVVDGFVHRYDSRATRDGLPPGEGTFLACSFWLADNLMLQGRVDEANAMFDRLLSIRNDVGLLAEEYDPVARRQLGNFPQAFSHLALVGTALNLTRTASRPIEQRHSRRDGS
ncbi:MAG: glycoside hydrolase family 15 protein [Kofleriaceae bacterium]